MFTFLLVEPVNIASVAVRVAALFVTLSFLVHTRLPALDAPTLKLGRRLSTPDAAAIPEAPAAAAADSSGLSRIAEPRPSTTPRGGSDRGRCEEFPIISVLMLLIPTLQVTPPPAPLLPPLTPPLPDTAAEFTQTRFPPREEGGARVCVVCWEMEGLVQVIARPRPPAGRPPLSARPLDEDENAPPLPGAPRPRPRE